MDALTAFRISEPLLVFINLSLLIFLFLLSWYWNQVWVISNQLLRTLLTIADYSLVGLILAYLTLVIAYLLSNTFFDQAEPNIAAVSWLFKTGSPLFPPMDAAERYINNYGAVLYIINSFFLTLFGPSFFSVKLGCGLAAIFSVGCIFLIAAKVASRQIALLVCAYAILAMLSITNSFAFHAASFWLRPDPLLIFFVSVGLLSVLSGNRAIATLVTAIAFGCSLNLKVNAFVNFLSIYSLLFWRFGLVTTLVSVAGATITAALPFILSPQISLSNYLVWLSQSRHKATSFEQLVDVSKWVFYISLPILLSLSYLFYRSRASFHHFIRHHQTLIYPLLGGLIASLAFSIKIGVLENNHLPFIPLFAYLLALILQWIRVEQVNFLPKRSQKYIEISFVSAALALIITMPLAIAPEAARLVSTLIKSPANQIIDDINQIMQAHPHAAIGMGFSQGPGNYELTYYRPTLVFAGNPYLVDAVVMFEMQASGVDTVSSGTLQALQSCQTQLWLLPKVTQQPFDLKNFYPPHDLIFSQAFRKSFLQNYQPAGESQFYHLWACKGIRHTNSTLLGQ